jgi:hypothetical protein
MAMSTFNNFAKSTKNRVGGKMTAKKINWRWERLLQNMKKPVSYANKKKHEAEMTEDFERY